MYCPNDECPEFVAYHVRGEYREEIATCPRCGAQLALDFPGDQAWLSARRPKVRTSSAGWPGAATWR